MTSKSFIKSIDLKARSLFYYLSWLSEPLSGTLQTHLNKSPRGQLIGMELEIILGIFQVSIQYHSTPFIFR
ncbi:hypothetical protein ACTXT7_015981 [Hymenolepis weldensis]